jgi:glycosyltransferase involved in cell wall biosynthesis
LEWGAAYFEACRAIAGQKFTDIILLPYIARGGAEKYIFGIVDAITKVDPSRRFLILSGEASHSEHALNWLPANATFVDLYATCKNAGPDGLNIVTLRLIQSQGPRVKLHLKASHYAQSFFSKFKFQLHGVTTIYYYFSDMREYQEGINFTCGYSFEFVSANHNELSILVSDHKKILEDLKKRVPVASKCAVVPAYCALPPHVLSQPASSFRLLWASRLDPEKRPELLPKIAKRLKATGADYAIDVYGSPAYGYFDTSIFREEDGIYYRGPFDRFSSIPASDYSAFLYTTHYDGLPNVVLEALASGLPVISTATGGIAEAVDNTRGILIDPSASEDVLVERYVSAIREIASADLSGLRKFSREFVANSHSLARLTAAISENAL